MGSSSTIYKLLMFCVREKKFKFRLNQILEEEDFRRNHLDDILSTIHRASCLFQTERIHDELFITIKIKLNLCKSYNYWGNCNKKCYKLHLCQKIILNKHCEKDCRLNHYIMSSYNKHLIELYHFYTEPSAILKFYQIFYCIKEKFDYHDNKNINENCLLIESTSAIDMKTVTRYGRLLTKMIPIFVKNIKKQKLWILCYSTDLDKTKLIANFRLLMHKPDIKFSVHIKPSGIDYNYKITISLNETLKLKMLALGDQIDENNLKDLFEVLMKNGSYPVIIDSELKINPVDEFNENKEWKINVKEIIDCYLDRFILKLIGLPNYKYDLEKLKKKVKESSFRSKIFYFVDEFSIIHLMAHLDNCYMLDLLLVSCLKEKKSSNSTNRSDQNDYIEFEISSPISTENNDIYDVNDSISVITITDDDSDKENENEERRDKDKDEDIQSTISGISLMSDCSINDVLVYENDDSIDSKLISCDENSDTQERNRLIKDLEEMNKDKENPLYFLNQLIIDNYYKTYNK